MQNFIKTILSAVQTWTKRKIANSSAELNSRINNSKADWNENNPKADSYVRNRTHWEDEGIVPNTRTLVDKIDNLSVYLDDPEFITHLRENKEKAKYFVNYGNGESECSYAPDSYDAQNDRWLISPLDNLGRETVIYIQDGLLFAEDGGGEKVLYSATITVEYKSKIVHKLDSKFIPDDIGVQSDWNQNDMTAKDYIMNKPFYLDGTIVYNSNVYRNSGSNLANIQLESDTSYIITVDGFTFTGIAYSSETDGNIVDLYDQHGATVGSVGGWTWIDSDFIPKTSFLLKVVQVHDLKQLDKYFLPIPSAHEVGALYAENPTGTGSFNMNGHYTGKTGKDSIGLATGGVTNTQNLTTLGAYNAHEPYVPYVVTTYTDYGYFTKPNWYRVHQYHFDSETGVFVLDDVSINSSFPTVVDGIYAENYDTDLNGKKVSKKLKKVIECTLNNANVVRYYIAYTQYTSMPQQNTRGKYAFMVGNGQNTNTRSNAHTLDWEGNAWYQGDVYVGSTSGTNKDDGSKKLITLDDVKPNVLPVFGEWYRLENGMEIIPYIEGYNFNTYYNSLVSGVPTVFKVGYEELDVDVENSTFYIGENDMFYCSNYSANNITLIYNINSSINLVVQLSESGIHVSIENSSVIIYSSTEGSAKKFKITVDDSGTLSAVEVV